MSLPIVCIGLGAALFSLPQVRLVPSPLAYPGITERFTEFVVIIALMAAGLKLDRVFGLHRWEVTWRLIIVTLSPSIVAITLLAGTWMGLSWPVALLLGAALAPTDPVLASDVQVGPPRTGEEDEVRFGLTSEAGMNDGAAFPFVHLAIALALAGTTGETWALTWLSYNVLWEIGAGVAGGDHGETTASEPRPGLQGRPGLHGMRRIRHRSSGSMSRRLGGSGGSQGREDAG